MNDERLARRGFLLASASGLFGTVATRFSDGSDIATAAEVDRADALEDQPLEAVYEGTIDSVTLVRAFGLEDPMTGEGEGQGQGSGLVVDDSHVVTNEHVVSGAEEVDLQYTTGEWTETEVVGTDVVSDLAVLEVDELPETATPLSFSDAVVDVGQEVLAIGNPFGLEGSMSRGIVSGVDRSLFNPITGVSIPHAVQTDAGLNPGNSGGPLVDLAGEVIGVVNAGGGDNIGFAISAPLSQRVVPSLIEDGEYRHPFVGVGVVTVDRIVAEENDVPEATGVLVTDVQAGGPAAGVLEGSDGMATVRGEEIPVGGDVIRAIDGEPIPDEQVFSTFLALEASPGDELDLEVYREGSTETVTITVGERPTP
ncbi:S1C family serine protease [Natrialbaceae archaeon A-gly3]